MPKLNLQQLTSMSGKPVYASDDSKIGEMETLYYDVATDQPEWIAIEAGFFGKKRMLVPVEGAQLKDGQSQGIRVPYSKDKVKNTPDVSADEISEETERQLYAHYGIQPTERRSEMQLPEGRQAPMHPEGRQAPTHPTGEMSATRHEEELHVGKRETESGRVRLRKWVETEPVSEDVTLRRETAHVTREELNRPAPGAQFGEQEAELTLHEEEPVVEKEVMEKERVTLEPEEEMHQEKVRGEVRKEHIEVEGDTNITEDERRRKAG